MARKPKAEEHENHERWLVSYADFITLLFAFFVVMYSISSVNEGKYRVLSSTMASAFASSAKSLNPIQHGTKLGDPIIQHSPMKKNANDAKKVKVEKEITPTPKEIAKMQKLADEIQYKLQILVDNDEIKVSKTNKGVEIEIKSNVLFSSGQAYLQSRARKIITDIADILVGTKTPINIEGFTDNVPIKTSVFPSNWVLSSARAANVAHLFGNAGINPTRLAAIGFGEFQPIADNNTTAGRKANRRINIVVMNRMARKRKHMAPLNKKAIEKEINTKKLPIINLFSTELNKGALGSTKALSSDKKSSGSIVRKPVRHLQQKIISLDDKGKKSTETIPDDSRQKPILFSLPPPTPLSN